MRVASSDTNQRSWDTNSTVPGYARRAATSAWMASMSRWLVGSSSTSTLGRSAASRAKISRAASPPDSVPMRLSTSSPENSTRPRALRTNVVGCPGYAAHTVSSAVAAGSVKVSRWSWGK